jgi:hypothetical protein
MKKLMTISAMLLLMSFSWVANASVTLNLRNQTNALAELHVHYQANGLPYQFWGVLTDKLSVTSVISGTNITIQDLFVLVLTDNSGYGKLVPCNPVSSAFIYRDPTQVIVTVTSSGSSHKCTASNV